MSIPKYPGIHVTLPVPVPEAKRKRLIDELHQIADGTRFVELPEETTRKALCNRCGWEQPGGCALNGWALKCVFVECDITVPGPEAASNRLFKALEEQERRSASVWGVQEQLQEAVRAYLGAEGVGQIEVLVVWEQTGLWGRLLLRLEGTSPRVVHDERLDGEVWFRHRDSNEALHRLLDAVSRACATFAEKQRAAL